MRSERTAAPLASQSLPFPQKKGGRGRRKEDEGKGGQRKISLVFVNSKGKWGMEVCIPRERKNIPCEPFVYTMMT